MSYQTPEDREQFEADMYPRYQEFCERVWPVACECGEMAFETQETLERLGWQLKDGIEICPSCVAYLGGRWQ